MAANPKAASDRQRVAIAIPAYGRADAIAAAIAAMSEEARDSDLPVTFYVSDDSPDTSVAEALGPLIANDPSIRYRRNEPALGHDRNVVATLLWPDEPWVWPLGSGFRAAPGRLKVIVGFLGDQDMVFLNLHLPEQRSVPAVGGGAARAMLRDRLWHHTLTGVTIYGSRVREWVRRQGDALVVKRNFPQISVMLGYASSNDPIVGWLGGSRNLASSGSNKASYWRARAIDVFADDWSAAVAAFPAVIPTRDAMRVTREHSRRTDLFNTTTLIALKASGQFTWSSLGRRGVRWSMHVPWWKQVAILALPVAMLRGGSKALVQLKQRAGRREREAK